MTTNYVGQLCAGCGRSIWHCPMEDGPDCRAYVAAPSCGDSVHISLLARRPAVLLYRGIVGDLVQLDCPRCGERVEISRAVALRASAPIGMARCPDDDITREMPAISMAELVAEAHERLGI